MYLNKFYDVLVETNIYIQFFKDLFAFNQNRVEIMNETAGTFFVLCQNAIVEAVIMRLSKLTDRSRSLTIRTLLKRIVPIETVDYGKIDEKIEKLEKHLEIVRMKRDKHIGHLDLSHFDQEIPVTLEALDQAAKMLEELFNAIVMHLPGDLPEGLKYNRNTAYVTEPTMDPTSDAVAALIMLKKGLWFEQLVQELPIECLEKYIPRDKLVFQREYFQDAVLEYVYESSQPDYR
jgi:rRNA-processing protein FCF1